MSPPLSRLERGDPPPRRKSCLACVKSKRRCDQRFPACLRCAQRKISCDYPSQTARTRSPRPQPQRDSNTLSAPKQTRAGDGVDPETIAAGYVSTSTSPNIILYEDFPADDEAYCYSQLHENSIVNAEGPALSAQFTDIPSWTTVPDEMFLHEDVVADAEVSWDMALTRMASTCTEIAVEVSSQLASPRGFNVEAVTKTFEETLSYAVDKMKSAPSQMLLEMQTPWCHGSLYTDGLPHLMQEALSACALYVSKNSVNGPVIMRCIHTKLDNLVESEMPTEFLHALARTQALILYQIILFFDGDIIARSSANATFSDLQSSAHALAGHIKWNTSNHNDSDRSGLGGDNYNTSLRPLQPSRNFWREWILQESARRTFLIARFFIHVWKLLTGLQPAVCGDNPPLMSHTWTLSSHLWKATDALDFAAAWMNKKHYVVKRRAILSTLADANGDDVEVFGKMLLTVALGIDEAAAYLSLKGSSL